MLSGCQKIRELVLPVTTVLKNKRTGQRTTYPANLFVRSLKKPSGSLQVFKNLVLGFCEFETFQNSESGGY
jgi:hypothetical protein